MAGRADRFRERGTAGKRLPGRSFKKLLDRPLAQVTLDAAGHFVAMLHQRIDLEVVKGIEIRADRRHLCLHYRMEAVGILLRLDHTGDRHEVIAVLVAEVFPLQLPDAIPEDVGGADRLGNKAERLVAENLKRLAGIADDHAVVGPAMVLGKPGKGPSAKVVVDASVGKGFVWEVSLANPQIVGRDRDRRKEAGKGARRGDHLGDAGHPSGNVAKAVVLPFDFVVAAFDEEAVAVEDSEDAVADVCRQDVEAWLFRQFEQPAVAVEKLLVVVLEQGVGGEPSALPAAELGEPAKAQLQGESSHDVVADVKLHKADDLGRGLRKLLIAAGVAIPVEHQVGCQDAATGNRCDVADRLQGTHIPHVADHAEMKQRGSKATTREGKAVVKHATCGARGITGSNAADSRPRASRGTTAHQP